MKLLNSTILKKFLTLAADDLSGEWLLIGGTLLPAVGLDIRPTVDIDLVGLGPKEKLQNLELMAIAEKLGLSIETINQAAEYFVAKAKVTKKDLIILKRGSGAIIYRPSVELYWRLKTDRLTESDRLDCQHYYSFCKGQKDKISLQALDQILNLQLKKENNQDKYERLQLLKKLIH